jgi:hypothetical protein
VREGLELAGVVDISGSLLIVTAHPLV